VGAVGVKPASIHFKRGGRWDERPILANGHIGQSVYIPSARPSLLQVEDRP
jgi:hypothetical protein